MLARELARIAAIPAIGAHARKRRVTVVVMTGESLTGEVLDVRQQPGAAPLLVLQCGHYSEYEADAYGDPLWRNSSVALIPVSSIRYVTPKVWPAA
jgi:hypothetical protein